MVVLNPLESAAIISVFEDAVLQLNILSTLDGDRGCAGTKLRPLTDETDLGISDRLRRQRVRIKMMLERIIGRLSVSSDIGSLFESLTGSKSDIDEDMEGENEDAAEARRKIAETEKDIASAKATIAGYEAVIAHLKDEDRLGENEDLAARHVALRWADARLQLLQWTQCRQEDATRRMAEDTRIQKRQEYRVHSEVMRCLRHIIELMFYLKFDLSPARATCGHGRCFDLERQIQLWEERYKTQTVYWTDTLKKLVTEKELHATRLSYVKEKLDQRMEFCAEVLRIREQKRIEAETRKRRNDAATRIQAWWRGHMVRRGFAAIRKRFKQKQRPMKS